MLWEISTLPLAPISIRLIQGEIITKLQHLLIGSYFSTYTNPSINDIKTHKSEMFFLKLNQGRDFPMCTKKGTLGVKKIVLGPKQPAQALYRAKSGPQRSLYIFFLSY